VSIYFNIFIFYLIKRTKKERKKNKSRKTIKPHDGGTARGHNILSHAVQASIFQLGHALADEASQQSDAL
jgi:hypothetical protein